MNAKPNKAEQVMYHTICVLSEYQIADSIICKAVDISKDELDEFNAR